MSPGPDHLAALAPLVIGQRRSIFAAFGLGALWGSGHATGQLATWLLSEVVVSFVLFFVLNVIVFYECF